ncbi:Peptidoglycan-recognition protein-SC2 [Fibrella aestuarina BUZ 2]|uniref:Peptidoglycan-recognition protein-SC2 n=1 Tax=Fibrella aestuarina BUZ 2 TaxID=1166018 RepID=I0KCF7_9BACT|nr:N-acetylmuramoyl-L-alanine amidase [Fibrella aestuarina]CCH01810.1 Peptidoglycan-recognition protein-SC2 [Fibrella aestuarina BUZ 2]
MKSVVGLVLLLMQVGVQAQSLRSVAKWPVLLPLNRPARVPFDQPYSSALLRLPPGQPLDGIYLVADGDTITLRPEPHSDSNTVSGLCVFRQPVRAVTLLSTQLTYLSAELITLYAPPLPADYVAAQVRAARAGATDCDKPAVVPVLVWRKGLAPPKEPPTPNKVQFVIVHHSATSNTATNYLDEVRNIYLQHTTVNGWNDVGYNFLLGRDGVVYEGRDGQGVLDGDNVLGAHFCSTNTGTMGICMLGNYNDVQPSDTALAAVNQLIGWKLRKEGLEPVGQALHASSAKVLNRISGHRDGVCATECPGNNLYARLGAMRQSVGQLCSFTSVVGVTPLATEPTADWLVYPNPADGPITVQHQTTTPKQVRFDWLDGQGRSWAGRASQLTASSWRIELPVGGRQPFWLLRCTDGQQQVVRKVMRTDTD